MDIKVINSNDLQIQLSNTMNLTSYAILEVLQGRSLTCFLDKIDSPIRPSVQSLSFHSMRYLGWASSVGKYLIKKYPNKLFESLWLLSLTLLKFSNFEKNEKHSKFIPIYKEFVIVNEAVNAINSMPLLKPYKSLLNAGLRNFLRKRSFLEKMVADKPEACWNYQGWWINNLRHAYSDNSWKVILSSANSPAPLAIRVNSRQIDRDSVLNRFLDNDIDCCRFGDSGIIIQKKIQSKIANLVGFSEGWWCVQDAGAQLVAPILDVKDGMSVLDACAAPGGKSSHLLELANIKLLALDYDEIRLNRMKKNLERLKLYSDNVKLILADASDLYKWWDGKLFDVVLADVPCSASGIVRKHPDIRWLRKESDIKNFVLRQIKIIDALWNTVAPGGKLLYVTCSVFYEECIGQALAFLDRHSDAVLLDSPAQILPVDSDNDKYVSHDGFFFALFNKKY